MPKDDRPWDDPLSCGFRSVTQAEADVACRHGWIVIGPIHGTDRLCIHRPAPLHTLRAHPHDVEFE